VTHRPPSARRLLPVLALVLALATGGHAQVGPAGPGRAAAAQADACADNPPDRPCDPRLRERGGRTGSLAEHANDAPSAPVIPPALRERRALLAERARLRAAGDAAGVARLNSVLASEAFARAARVAARWLDRRDPATGLFPHTLRPDGRRWTYGDVGSDLFPFLAIATRHLLPERYGEILATLRAERDLTTGLPFDVSLDSRFPIEQEDEKRMLGVVEYAKDGLLPLVEAVGPDPWLARLEEVMSVAIARADVPTPHGPIPSPAAEVNGSALQALARLYRATGKDRYLQAGRRIAAAYHGKTLDTTEHIPPHRWDFIENEPIGPRRFFLGDHGNEIVAGLVEWSGVEADAGLPEAAAHRAGNRKLLDRLLKEGRTPDGLWYELLDVPSGRVRDKDLTDNWGYLGQAYLLQAALERAAPDGDLAAAARYEAAAARMLRAVATVDFYAWEEGEMDGYADTLEGALYLLRYLDVPEAADWLDDQIGVLYGFQGEDGAVTDENIDGNFIRTVLLYGLAQTSGARVEPWTDGVGLGAARDGDCLALSLHAEAPWQGRLLLDAPRHRAHLGLPADYPRLNQWPERWAADPARRYALAREDAPAEVVGGDALAAGVPVSLEPGREYRLRACPAEEAGADGMRRREL
jgi:hypothetical protein